jgi:hypothetical protein
VSALAKETVRISKVLHGRCELNQVKTRQHDGNKPIGNLKNDFCDLLGLCLG